MIRRIAKYLLILFLLYLALGTLAVFLFHKRANGNPLPAGMHKGIFHVHSTFSDGSEDWPKIAAAAAENKLEFVVISDHGRPNRQAALATTWDNGVLLIGTSEFSTHGGHLMAGTYSLPAYRFPPEPQEAIDEVGRDGGLTVVSHPFDRKIPWTDWNIRGFDAIDIINSYKSARGSSIFRLFLFPSRYLFNSDYALTSLISAPQKEIELWDRLNRREKCSGIYALDAHGQFKLPFGLKIRFPAHSSMFRILTVTVKTERELDKDARKATQQILTAIKAGDFFNTIESLAPANGFDWYYEEKDRAVISGGGSSMDDQGKLVCHVPFGFPYLLRLYRDGRLFHTAAGREPRVFRLDVPGPGAYRAQVHMAGGPFQELPWILANPIRIGLPEAPAPPPAPPVPRKYLAPRMPEFKVEKNPASLGSLTVSPDPAGAGVIDFAFGLFREPGGSPDFWTALACRNPLDFSGYRGLQFSVQGSERMRFWLQFRTGGGSEESAFRHSFRIEKEWTTVAIPFERLPRLYGKAPRLDTDAITSLFIAIDGEIAYSGTTGWIKIRDFALF